MDDVSGLPGFPSCESWGRTAQLATSAYLASAMGCLQLVHQILLAPLLDIPYPHFEAALYQWREGHPYTPPDHPAFCMQRRWDSPKIDAVFNSLLETANQLSKACLLAVSRTESGAWLHALPISSVGLRMGNEVVRVAVSLRLVPIDELGIHGLSYRFSRGRHS